MTGVMLPMFVSTRYSQTVESQMLGVYSCIGLGVVVVVRELGVVKAVVVAEVVARLHRWA